MKDQPSLLYLKHTFTLAVCAFLLISSASCCGYTQGFGGTAECYRSICIPYVQGDTTGELTTALARNFSKGSSLHYLSNCADLKLTVFIAEEEALQIGYRYDTEALADSVHILAPTETRLNLLASITLEDCCTGCKIIDCQPVTASIEFDHGYYTNENSLNTFSLGQLNDLGLAQINAKPSLYEELAKEIVSRVNTSW